VKEQTLERRTLEMPQIIIKNTDIIRLLIADEPEDELHPRYKLLVIMPWVQQYKLFESSTKVGAQREFERVSSMLQNGKRTYGIRIMNPAYAEVVEIHSR